MFFWFGYVFRVFVVVCLLLSGVFGYILVRGMRINVWLFICGWGSFRLGLLIVFSLNNKMLMLIIFGF